MRWQWRIYEEPLQEPLTTAQGIWRSRSGIYLRLEDEQGQVGYGEIAPLPGWGSETLNADIALCEQLPGYLTPEIMATIPEALPAAQFGFATAWQSVGRLPYRVRPWPICALLGSGQAALEQWQQPWQRGQTTFKWKVGVLCPEAEQEILKALLAALPQGAKLRLDANGGWDVATATRWLTWLDRHGNGKIEYVEQPLPPDQWQALLSLAQAVTTAIALDESVVNAAQLQRWVDRGWPGLFVIKPVLFGPPEALSLLLRRGLEPQQLVFSSALEGAIARTAIFHLLETWQPCYALGFGVDRWRSAPLLTTLAEYDAEWHRLDNYGKTYYK
ncbi:MULTISPECIES: o-succinylbenzoate synthase [unclassified Thermosynechococcus]|jgi:O-succinylbenzoate synthase|uniref:o-succinylbenzoate synthase n=1 Tax=unclassified Thermosynechococcus TaxID=2622553 RepID=UPI0019F6DD11|nr:MULTISPECIES: o-succinylbenzoate synthase [unclassified Thermosynechococcus]HIK23687.1 o-succinylbenzoate synthase [Thermosynechococcus sp. M3746_W2019_013]